MKLGGTGSSPVLLSPAGGHPRLSERRRDMRLDQAPRPPSGSCRAGRRLCCDGSRGPRLPPSATCRSAPARHPCRSVSAPREGAGHRGPARTPRPVRARRRRAAPHCQAGFPRAAASRHRRDPRTESRSRPTPARPEGVRSARPAWRCGSRERGLRTCRTDRGRGRTCHPGDRGADAGPAWCPRRPCRGPNLIEQVVRPG